MAQPLLPSSAQYFRSVFEIPGGYINDHCLIRADSLWHLFFIQGKLSNGSWDYKGNEVIIGHATSPDLLAWTLHEPALRVGPPGSLDAAHIYAPGVIYRQGVYYMFYTGNEQTYYDGEHIFLATSTDLFNWTRYSSDPILAPDSSWASYYPVGHNGGSGGPASCRDPHLFQDGNSFYYVCYYVAKLKADSTRPSQDQEFSCVAAATSTDLIHWVDRGPVLTRRTRGEDAYSYGHPESPCVITRDNLYYLFWKSGSGIRYVISDNPLDFHDRDQYFLATSHASEMFEWNDRWYVTSCSRNVDDVVHGISDRTRGLFLASIVWEGRHPVVTSLPADFPKGADSIRKEEGTR